MKRVISIAGVHGHLRATGFMGWVPTGGFTRVMKGILPIAGAVGDTPITGFGNTPITGIVGDTPIAG